MKKKHNIQFIICIVAVVLAIGTYRFYTVTKETKKTEENKPQVINTEITDHEVTPPEELPIKNEKPTMAASTPDANTEIKEETNITFRMPSDDPVALGYSSDTLVYFHDMGDWRVHQACDYASENEVPVYSIKDGVVTDVYNDTVYGTTISIQHSDNLISYYSSLSETTVQKDQNVKAGEIIGKSGNTAEGEKSLGNHLHFSIKKDGAYITPESLNG